MLEKLIKLCFYKNNFELIKLIENAKIDNKIETMCIKLNDYHIYYNEEFLKSLDLKTAYFVFNHEFLHLVYNHCERGKNHKNKLVSNTAADILVNEILEDILKIKIPEKACKRTTEKSKTLETLYNELLENNNEDDKKPDYSDLQNEEEQEQQDKEKKEAESGKEEENSEVNNTQDEDKYTKEIKEIIESFKEKIDYEKQKENTIIKSDKKVSIFEFLKNKIGKLITYNLDRNWNRPNRYNLPYIPNNRIICYKPIIDIYIDISGSMEQKPLKIIGNLKNIKKILKQYKANYYLFNTKIYDFDIENNSIKIGGGTNINNVINNIRKNSDLSIVITDCEDDYTNNNKKVIFISNNTKRGDIICDDNFENIII